MGRLSGSSAEIPVSVAQMAPSPLWEIGTGSANDVKGKAVIVHAMTDDFMTQPTGNAGGRIGCGVIK